MLCSHNRCLGRVQWWIMCWQGGPEEMFFESDRPLMGMTWILGSFKRKMGVM